jgi:hypothetical protein
MAIGDDAVLAGYPLVDGDTDKVIDGDQEINRTRDFVAQVKFQIPVGKTAYRGAVGITSGTLDPDDDDGSDGDIYFKVIL